MADKKVDIDILLNTAKSAKNVRELRQVMKELSFAQEEVDKSSPDFEKLTAGINEVEGRIGDLNDAMKTFAGSGMERLSSSTNLLSESFATLDLDKMKVAFQGLKQLPKALAGEIDGLSKMVSSSNLNFKSLSKGMKGLADSGVGQLTKSIIQLGKAILTNPILLLAAVIIGLIAVVIKFADKIKPVRIIMDSIGKAIDYVVQKLKDFADWMGITDFAGEKSAEKQLNNYARVQESVEKRYDGEIRLAAAAGKDTFDLEKKKLYAVQYSVKKQIEAINRLREINGKLTKEQVEQLKELKDALQTNVIDIKELDIKKTKEKSDKEKKDSEEAKKRQETANEKSKQALAQRVAANKTALEKIKDQEIDLYDEERKRETEKLKLENDRAVQSINDSQASEAIKNSAIETQRKTFNKKMLDLKTKYDDEDKKKTLETELVKSQIAESQDQDNLSKKLATLEVQKEIDLLNAKDDATKKLKIENDYQLAIKSITKETANKEQNDLLQNNLYKAKLDEMRNEDSLNAKIAVLEAEKQLELQAAGDNNDAKLAIEQDYLKKIKDLKDQEAENEKKKRKEVTDVIVSTGQNAIDSLSTMSANYFDGELKRAGNNQAQRNKILKKQFNTEKAFNLARAAIDGTRSVMAAMELPPPASYIMAGINAAMAISNIAKISSQQFTPEGGSSTPNVSAGSAGSGSIPTQNFTAPQFYGLGQTQTMSNIQQQKVVVVETDITKTQNKVSGIQAKATQSL